MCRPKLLEGSILMAGQPSYSNREPPDSPDHTGDSSTPRWVKVFAIVTVVLILLVLAVMLIGGGSHGPGRHVPSAGVGHGPTPSSRPAAFGAQL